jgi:hypothetical protein
MSMDRRAFIEGLLNSHLIEAHDHEAYLEASR